MTGLVLTLLASRVCVATPSSLPPVRVHKLETGVWIHTAYQFVRGYGNVLSNGLLVQGQKQIYLIDTAWNDKQTQEIIVWSRKNLGRMPDVAILTHAHIDKMGGMEALHKAGISTFAHTLSNRLASSRNLKAAQNNLPLKKGDTYSFGSGEILVLYPGGGHTEDNIVVYIPKTRVVHGGCLIKAATNRTIGYTKDANISHWDNAIRLVQHTFPKTKIVVPSHGPAGTAELFGHTIDIVRTFRENTQLH